MESKELVYQSGIFSIAQKTLNCVDARLVDHGLQVAYVVWQMLKEEPGFQEQELWHACFLALLHDIGAYKTEEIDDMVQFETEHPWEHAVYGHLFLLHFSPLSHLSAAILYHHTDWARLENIKDVPKHCARLAQLIHLADRVSIYLAAHPEDGAGILKILKEKSPEVYCPWVVNLYEKARVPQPLSKTARQDEQFLAFLEKMPQEEEERTAYLRMLVYAIDFRSSYTVTHTVTTASISEELARRLCLSPEEQRQIACGALLHDLGKVGIPLEILEYPGKLSPQAMRVMRTHVQMTEKILQGGVSPAVQRIALRHHEKLNGTGYPLGLTAAELSPGERVVAVADIVSALCGVRSYKGAYSREKILSVLSDMAKKGEIDAQIVERMVRDYDSIMAAVGRHCQPVLRVYEEVLGEFQIVLRQFKLDHCIS